MRTRRLTARTLTAATLLGACHLAQAGLLGSTVVVGYRLANQATNDKIVVTSDVEFTCPTDSRDLCTMLTASVQTLDIDDTSIRYRYSGSGSGFNNVDPNGFDFQNLIGLDIAQLLLDTDIAGLDLSRVTFDQHSVQVDMRGLVLPSPGAYFTVNLVPAANHPAPEPTSVPLVGLALAGAAAAWRRRTLAGPAA